MKKLLFLLTTLFSFCACRKAQTIEVNLHENVGVIDCRNLIVRSVALSSDHVITIDVENTCANCDVAVHPPFLMIDRITNDTIGTGICSCGVCESLPENKTIKKYVLGMSNSSIKLSKMENFRFEMSGVCGDMTYLPK